MHLMLTVAAQKMGVSRRWIHTLVDRGTVNTEVIGGRRYVLDDEKFSQVAAEIAARRIDNSAPSVHTRRRGWQKGMVRKNGE